VRPQYSIEGLIRAAQGGVLSLDEIGELDDTLQGKLWRVLQESRILGVGEDREVAANVRIMAATNQRGSHSSAARLTRRPHHSGPSRT
jgi:transcriptional regulator with PAS, ATPase and Fis domain